MSSSTRSSTSTENSTIIQWDPPICPVCEITAPNGKHFGINCCGACAAFFRRTVSEQKLFQCTKGAIETMTMFPSLLQACRHCRYLKCIKSGMKLEKVQTKRIKTAVPTKHINVINISVGEIIDTIVQSNHYVEHERCTEYGPIEIEFKKSTMSGAVSIAKTELRLMQQFLQNNGLLNLVPENHLRDFIKQGYYLWAQTSSLWLSYTQGGYSANRMCYVDRSFVDINELAVERIYSCIPGIRHVDTIVRHAMPVYFEFRSILRLIQIYRLDHVEWLIVVQY
uniref:Nuclear receptor domain-containing protein n=1 Tax=Panagrolaimus sp. PS1159 TaxID=55785 RepID=A0AC35F3J4_9BILA